MFSLYFSLILIASTKVGNNYLPDVKKNINNQNINDGDDDRPIQNQDGQLKKINRLFEVVHQVSTKINATASDLEELFESLKEVIHYLKGVHLAQRIDKIVEIFGQIEEYLLHIYHEAHTSHTEIQALKAEIANLKSDLAKAIDDRLNNFTENLGEKIVLGIVNQVNKVRDKALFEILNKLDLLSKKISELEDKMQQKN